MPTIATSRLILKPITKATQRQVDWLRDPDVVRFSEQRHKAHSLRSQLSYITTFRGIFLGIHDVTTGAHIGNITAAQDPFNGVSDIGIMIGEKKFWGKGFGVEAWKAFCDWLLDRDQGAARKLEAGCMKTNLPMLKILKKTGFVQEGERVNHFIAEGTFVSAMLFGRFR